MKLNLGAGEDIRQGFVNIDVRPLKGIDIVCDAGQLRSHFPNDSVDFIVAQHILEYIPRARLVRTLQEWRRALKPKGVLEIRTTDISALTKALYLNTVSKEMGLHHEMVLSLLYGAQRHAYDVRLNGFTGEFLQGVLTGLDFIILNVAEEEYDIIISAEKKEPQQQ